MKKVNPKSLAIMICELVVDDKAIGKKALVGLLNHVSAAAVPYTHPKLNVYVSLTGGFDEYRMVLRCVQATGDSEIFRMEGIVQFLDPGQIVEFTGEIAALTFPDYGAYRFELLCDDDPVSTRPFHVLEKVVEADES
jgi:hypothetical protein